MRSSHKLGAKTTRKVGELSCSPRLRRGRRARRAATLAMISTYLCRSPHLTTQLAFQIEAADLGAMIGNEVAAVEARTSPPNWLRFTRRPRCCSSKPTSARLAVTCSSVHRTATLRIRFASSFSEFGRADSYRLRTGSLDFNSPWRRCCKRRTNPRRTLERLLEWVELMTPSKFHLVFIGLLRHRHGLSRAPSANDLMRGCRGVGFGEP